jgi:membrane-associated phospholipid phosphatase
MSDDRDDLLDDFQDGPWPGFSRRSLLWGGAALAGTALAGAAPVLLAAPGLDGRSEKAYQARLEAARLQRDAAVARQAANGDEDGLPRRIACFSKCLPHNHLGEVEPGAYELLLRALKSGDPKTFEEIPIGGRVKLANPQSALAFNLIGPDPARPALPPAPSFGGAEQAAEMVELYWQALARDVPFSEYESHPLTARAAEDLSRLSAARVPRENGRVTPRTLFRGSTAGDLTGPYVSQLLWKDVFYTPIRIEQKIRTAVPGRDYLTDYDGWLRNQNGTIAGVNQFEPRPRYIRTGRDLGEYVHRDFTYQAPLSACLILLKMGALPDGGNPYKFSRTQSGFTTFGPPYLLYLLAVVTQVALTACWFQKWMVHRRLRPEELAGRVENHLRRRAEYPLHAELLGAGALEEVRRRNGTALLPQAFPEGCPTHPSYPAGHAAIAGACATVLKALFDESFLIPDPVMPSADGLSLRPYEGPALTLGGELDKLAANIGLGRDFAGVHWRSDTAAGLALGEEVAVSLLREMRLTGNELFEGFSFRRFDGRRVTV